MSKKLISVRDLSVRFAGNPEPVVSHVSFDINAGETLAIVGESGSGKSVTALSLLKLLPAHQVEYPEGEVRYAGQNLLSAPESELRKVRGHKVGYVFQEPMTSLNPLHTLEKQISETLRLHLGLDRESCRNRAIELLELVGIDSPEERLSHYPHQLSGGQRQRVMIAMALANEPELLIADEPTTALDVTVQQQILELLQSLQERLGMAILMISHDLNIVRRVADRVCVMHEGKIVESGHCLALFDQPQHPYTRKLMAAEPEGSPPPVSDTGSTILETHALKVWFAQRKGLLRRVTGYHKAVNEIDLQLSPGETLGIVGESGSGKSTLALAILRLISSRGDIYFKQQPLHPLKQKQMRPLRRELQIVFQDPFGSLSPRMSIAEIIAEGLEVQGIESPEARTRIVDEALQEVGLSPAMRNRYPHEFSGGQRQRIAIARALALKPSVIILDEPTSALDRTVQKQIITLLRDLQQRHGFSYLFISHDLAVVRAMSHRVMVMRHGQVVEEGDTETLFKSPQAEYTQKLIQASSVL